MGFLCHSRVKLRVIPPPHYGKNTKLHSATRGAMSLPPHHPGARCRTLAVGIIGWLCARVYELGNTPSCPTDFRTGLGNVPDG